MTSISISVPIKHLKASSGLFTIGSPLTLKDVFTNTGQLVIFLKFCKSLTMKELQSWGWPPPPQVVDYQALTNVK